MNDSVRDNRRAAALLLAMVVVTLLLCFGNVRAGEINTDSNEIAIKGYDTVAYFTMSRAVRGSEEIAYDWLGATWLFAKAEHRDTFAEDPIRYAPQYGGYCAIGVSFGRRVAGIDPELWRIVDDKLYLNYDPNVKGDSRQMIRRADKNWRKHKTYFTGQ